MAKVGMNVVRINMSHGTHEEKAKQIKNARKISAELKLPLAVIADLQGPKLRLGNFEGTIEINKGDQVNLSVSAREGEIPMQFEAFKKTRFAQKGDSIVIVTGSKIGVTGTTDTIKVATI